MTLMIVRKQLKKDSRKNNIKIKLNTKKWCLAHKKLEIYNISNANVF